MTGALDRLRRDAVELLREYGVQAVLGMEPERRCRWDGPVAAVSLSRVSCAAGGFRDYLGTRFTPERGEEELYGRGVELELAMDLYAPRDRGESGCQRALAVLTEAVTCRGIGGLTALEVTAGQVEYLEKDGLYRLPVRCRCKGWLVAAVDAGGTLMDIEVRGRRV